MASYFGRTEIQKSAGPHTATVIFLHGLGDSGSGIAPIGQALTSSASSQLSHVKFVFPTAPIRPVTMNGGAQMPAWFDLDPRIIGSVDHEGIQSSVDYLGRLVEDEIRAGVSPERIAIGGFSQGGHVSLKYLFNAKHPPAACIALSTWLEPTFNREAPESNKSVPIFVGHGSADPLLPLPLGQSTAALLEKRGFRSVKFKAYPGMQHSTCLEELADIRQFLLQVFPQTGLPTREDIDKMSVKELKAFLHSRSIDTRSMLEKSELVERARAAL